MRKVTLPKTERVIKAVLAAGGGARKAVGDAMRRGIHFSSSSRSGKSFTSKDSEDSIEEYRPIFQTLHEMWVKKYSELPVSKDIGRLARRCEIFNEDDGQALYSGKVAISELGDENGALILQRMIIVLIKAFENPDKHEELINEVESIISKAPDASDLSLIAEEILELLGESSQTVGVLKTIHQEIVLHCTYALKEHLTKKYMTKDVRTPEGWRIIILIGKERVQVLHIRKEQSIDIQGDVSNHWEFQWELRMLFNRTMTIMNSAQIRVTDLFLAETIDKALEEDLRKTLVGDTIVA